MRGRAGVAAGALLLLAVAPARSKPMFDPPGIVVVERARPVLVEVRVEFPVGARADPPGREGLAHLAWQTAIVAGGGRHSAAFAAALERIGAHLEVEVSADRTVVHGRVLLAHIDAYLALVADAVLRPTMTAADLRRQRALALADAQELLDEDEALAEQAARRYLYRGLPAGRPLHGDAESLRRITLEEVRRARARTVAAGLRFGFGGALPRQRAIRLIRTHFGPLARPRRRRRHRPTPSPVVQGRRLLLLDRPGRSQTRVVVLLPTVGARHRDMPALALAATALGGTFTSRLVRQLRELRGWTYSIDAGLRVGPDHGAIEIAWAPDNRVAAASIDLVMRHVELLLSDGLTDAELGFFRDHMQGAHTLALETAAGELTERLRALALGLPLDYPQRMSALLDRIDGPRLRAVLKARLDPARVVAVVVGDARRLTPALAKLASGFALETIPYDGHPERSSLSGRRVSRTPVPAPPPPPDDAGDEASALGPAFDAEGKPIDAAALPHAETPTEVDEPAGKPRSPGDSGRDRPGQ